MNIKKIIVILFLGIIGVFSLYFNPLPENLPDAIFEKFSLNQVKILTMINPAFLLLISAILGYYLAPNTQLKTPLIDNLLEGRFNLKLKEILIYSIIGLSIALFFILLKKFFTPYLPNEYLSFDERNLMHPITRIFYGGFTEEVIARYGIMTFLVWVLSKIFNKEHLIYYPSIIISAFLFAILHLPALFIFIKEINVPLLVYVIVGNITFGTVAGFLFWKKGLESSMLVHMFVHITLILIELL